MTPPLNYDHAWERPEAPFPPLPPSPFIPFWKYSLPRSHFLPSFILFFADQAEAFSRAGFRFSSSVLPFSPWAPPPPPVHRKTSFYQVHLPFLNASLPRLASFLCFFQAFFPPPCRHVPRNFSSGSALLRLFGLGPFSLWASFTFCPIPADSELPFFGQYLAVRPSSSTFFPLLFFRHGFLEASLLRQGSRYSIFAGASCGLFRDVLYLLPATLLGHRAVSSRTVALPSSINWGTRYLRRSFFGLPFSRSCAFCVDFRGQNGLQKYGGRCPLSWPPAAPPPLLKRD